MRMNRTMLVAAGALWIIASVAAVAALWEYAHRPGASGEPPSRWPASVSRDLLAADRHTLFVFFHSECPCSQATVNELERVAARAPGRFSARVYIHDAAGMQRPAAEGRLWKAASRIPGAQVLADHDGTLARTFGAETSGVALLYDRAGQLLFHGGITGARGHEGGNANEDALLACLREAPSAPTKTHAYGCSIF